MHNMLQAVLVFSLIVTIQFVNADSTRHSNDMNHLLQSRDLSTGSQGRYKCSLKPACAALGLSGDCCPTTDDGVFLDCCDNDSNLCQVNPVCNALGLEGSCCPTSDGVTLDCCNAETAQCSSNKSCEELDLEGLCCPTVDGVFLDCCNSKK
jgi:hypothetical protein